MPGERNPPLWLGSSSHSAEELRDMFRALRPAQGVVGAGDFVVTQTGSPSMGVLVAIGRALIDGTESSVQGSYAVQSDAAKTLTIAANASGNPRRDLIVAKIQDADYSGGVRAWSLAVVQGTPAGSPVDPAAPSNSITLARVAVANGASSIVNANITDLRVFMWSSIFPGGTGFGLFAADGTSKNLDVTDAGILTLRNGLKIPPSAGAALAPNSYGTVPVKIAQTTLGDDTSAQITWSSIPQTFKHLLIEYETATDGGSSNQMWLRFNNDSGATAYNWGELVWNHAGTVIADGTIGASYIRLGTIATLRSYGSIRIPNYTGASLIGPDGRHGAWCFDYRVDGGTLNMGLRCGDYFLLSPVAVNRIDLIANVNHYKANSVFSLYGLP